MKRSAVIFLALSIAFQTASIAFGKYAAVVMPHFTLANILANRFYFASLLCLGLQAITWQLTLTKLPLSYAYGAMSIVYVNVLIISVWAFHEHVSLANICGAALIISGVILMTIGRLRGADV
ncbi:MAG TPA: hypothetical protein VF381_12915 [Thermoanaerobaculia bacterium]